MKTLNKILLTLGLFCLTLNASSSTLTEISFNQDKDGNLNPDIFIPIYYDDNKNFYSGIGYSSSNSKEIDKVDSFSDSKSALISSTKKLTINYISYKKSIFFIGLKSELIDKQNSEFGYIHDSDDFFKKGTDYYIAFDNDIDLDIVKHGLSLGVRFDYGLLSNRLSSDIYPYSTIDVKQSTIFKPLVNKTGTSSSKTSQDISYSLKYEVITKAKTLLNLGFIAEYNYQPIKYDIAGLTFSEGEFAFETNKIDTNEVTTTYTAKLILNKKILGGLNPSIGFSKRYFDEKDNTTDITTSTSKNIVSLGFEKRF